jgi:hypothetical protein
VDHTVQGQTPPSHPQSGPMYDYVPGSCPAWSPPRRGVANMSKRPSHAQTAAHSGESGPTGSLALSGSHGVCHARQCRELKGSPTVFLKLKGPEPRFNHPAHGRFRPGSPSTAAAQLWTDVSDSACIPLYASVWPEISRHNHAVITAIITADYAADNRNLRRLSAVIIRVMTSFTELSPTVEPTRMITPYNDQCGLRSP